MEDINSAGEGLSIFVGDMRRCTYLSLERVLMEDRLVVLGTRYSFALFVSGVLLKGFLLLKG